MKIIDDNSIYKNKKYLESNPTWHIEDSPYKVDLILKAINRSGIQFENILDIGCGAGMVVKILSEKYPSKSFHGVDISPDAAKFFKDRNTTNLEYSHATDKFFDVAICLDVFEHVEDYIGFLKEIKAKAKFIIFNIPLDMNVIKLLSPGLRYARENVGHIHYFNSFTALETLKEAGYQIIDNYLSASFTKIPPRNIKQAFLLIPRLLTLLLGKKMGSILFGGISLVVTTSTE